jgi:hypothetical protein
MTGGGSHFIPRFSATLGTLTPSEAVRAVTSDGRVSPSATHGQSLPPTAL